MAISRLAFQIRLSAAYASPSTLGARLDGPPELPDDLLNWLTHLQQLSGVPFDYLVPDESMLPPESIRFFVIDPDWIAALMDGAFSLGRNLTKHAPTRTLALDHATSPRVKAQVASNLGQPRARGLGQEFSTPSPGVVSGFIVRSSVVSAYPGMGVYAYPTAAGPGDEANPNAPLGILRFESLGSDTLLCLIAGLPARIDLHEAVEHLHYGFDAYTYAPATGVTATKSFREFTIDGTNVAFVKNATTGATVTTPPENVAPYFRAAAPRTLCAHSLAAFAGPLANQTAPGPLDSAQMGFEMTQGVGNVTFLNPAL